KIQSTQTRQLARQAFVTLSLKRTGDGLHGSATLAYRRAVKQTDQLFGDQLLETWRRGAYCFAHPIASVAVHAAIHLRVTPAIVPIDATHVRAIYRRASGLRRSHQSYKRNDQGQN